MPSGGSGGGKLCRSKGSEVIAKNLAMDNVRRENPQGSNLPDSGRHFE
jgi:hypothetical protein